MDELKFIPLSRSQFALPIPKSSPRFESPFASAENR